MLHNCIVKNNFYNFFLRGMHCHYLFLFLASFEFINLIKFFIKYLNKNTTFELQINQNHSLLDNINFFFIILRI